MPIPPSSRTLARVPELIARLQRLGHAARLVDHTHGRVVPEPVGAVAFEILEGIVDVMERRARRHQRLVVRLRIDEGMLVVSTQSTAPPGSPDPILGGDPEEPLAAARAEALGGDVTVLPTTDGGWISILRLPLG